MSNPGFGNAVIGPQFCYPHAVELTLTTQSRLFNDADFVATDDNGNVVFKVMGKILSLRDKHVLADSTGNILITMQCKLTSWRGRWKVFVGNNTDPDVMLFSVRRASIFQFKTLLHVFSAANTGEEVCDFKIKGSFSGRSYTFYRGDSSEIAAKMTEKFVWKNVVRGKETYEVSIYPNTDAAFIISLVVIIHEINEAAARSQASAAT